MLPKSKIGIAVVRVVVAVIKHHDQSNLERKGFILPYKSDITVIPGRSQGRNSKWKTGSRNEAETMEEKGLLAGSQFPFLHNPGPPSQG